MSTVVIDDHLLRDVLTGDRPHDLDGLATGLATTGLWLFRLTSSFAAPGTVGKLSAPVKALPTSMQEQFRGQFISLPPRSRSSTGLTGARRRTRPAWPTVAPFS